MIRIVDFRRAISAGIVATLIWELSYRILQLFLPLRFDMVFGLGTMMSDPTVVLSWWLSGMAVHLTVGSIWAIFYAYFFWSVLPIRPVYQGMLFSLIQTLAAGLFLEPQVSSFHPLILSGAMQAPGTMGMNFGWQGFVELFAGHMIYGSVLGALYIRPVGHASYLELHPKFKKYPNLKSLRPLAQTSEYKNLILNDDFMFCTGIECSYPTIENGKWRFDQLELTRHYDFWERDLELVKELGLKYLRYGPPLHLIFQGPGKYDWSFMDAVAGKMNQLGISPIIDLCHFGVPQWLGNFQNTDFPHFLAEYAGEFAKRYSWIRLWNPVNEMYVTTKMSTIDGQWNEQMRSEKAFVRATLNVVQASRLSMQKICDARKDAIFITSESSEFYQPCCPDEKIQKIADFENQRRFLSTDLLHSLPVREDIEQYLYENGMKESEYKSLMQNRVSERIIMGLDYYEWNEKLINSRGQSESLGELFGWYVITKQYYDRYKRPLMHTETNCPDAEMAPAWLWRQWHNIQLMRQEGVPVVGFTWYSLQDQVDWDIALSKPLGNVFPVGLYDLNRDPRPVEKAYRHLLHLFKNEKISAEIARELGLWQLG